MAKDRTVYRVQPDPDGGWKLRKNEQTVEQFPHQREAIDRGRELARGDQPSQLLVHGKDGKIEDESTYQDDPFPPRG